MLADREAKVEITSANLRRLLEQVFEQGKSSGAEEASDSIFDSFFGRK